VACGRYLVYVRYEQCPRVTISVAKLNSPNASKLFITSTSQAASIFHSLSD
jgi:hypothetical protein